MRQLFYYKMQQKSITKCVRFFITKCNSFKTKSDSYLQIVTVHYCYPYFFIVIVTIIVTDDIIRIIIRNIRAMVRSITIIKITTRRIIVVANVI